MNIYSTAQFYSSPSMSSCFKIMGYELIEDRDEGEFLAELMQRLAQYTTRKTDIFYEKFPTDINDSRRPNYQKADRNKNMEATELLYAAAEEVTRLQENTGTDYLHFCAPPQKPCPNQFKQQKSMKKKQKAVQYMQQVQQDETRNGNRTGRGPGFSSSAWPNVKKSQFNEQPTPAGSGMQAVFLGNQMITKSERSGTGVFLPRPAGSWNKSSPEIARKKPGFSTVLLPKRFVHARNLNLGAVETPNQLNQNGFFHHQYVICRCSFEA